jgi:hypothetical protein
MAREPHHFERVTASNGNRTVRAEPAVESAGETTTRRMTMPIDQELANALEDLSLEPLETNGEMLEDALTAGYGMPELSASFGPVPLCCCSCCC